MELKDLRLYKRLLDYDTKLAGQVESVYNATKETIDSISGCYNNYTMHNMAHGLRVAEYMTDLAYGINGNFERDPDKFNAFEIALMILSSILHDIGMFIRPEDKEKIKANQISYTSSLTFSGVMNVVHDDEEEAIKEIVRITHAQRICEYIDFSFGNTTISGILKLDDKYPYAEDIVEICVGHGENYDYLKKLRSEGTKGKYEYNLQYIAALLRIADYLDLDSQRTPVLWYKMMRIDGFSKDEWEKHFVIHNEKKLKEYRDDKFQIFFEGKSANAKIHRKYLAYVDEIRAELERADELLNHKDTKDKYLFQITPKVEDCVATEGFRYSDLRLNLDYSSITELLMGNNIYGNKRLGLRELIQNALDACGLMKEIQESKGEEETYLPQISILISKEHGYVKIKDNGIGMTLDIIKRHFLNVGKSFYKSNEFMYESYEYKPIGQFGIGFLACFLLSDNVTVKTKFYESNEIHQIELEKNSEYVVTNTEQTGAFVGTEISLDYKGFFDTFKNIDTLAGFIKSYFYTSIPIVVKDVDLKQEHLKYIATNDELRAKISPDSSVGKCEYVYCNEYSSEIQGFIRYKEISRKHSFSINPMNNDVTYLFNGELGQFEPLSDEKALPQGYYRMVEYSNIAMEDYNQITSAKKSSKSRKNAIRALDCTIYLLFHENARWRWKHYEHKKVRATVDGVLFEDALAKSGLQYYEELVDDEMDFISIFTANNKYIKLQECYVYGRPIYISDAVHNDFVFYNKGIWVKDFFGVCCYIPAALEVSAVLNYQGDGIKLDVSRNHVISGELQIAEKITRILLKHIGEREKDDAVKEMITEMMATPRISTTAL